MNKYNTSGPFFAKITDNEDPDNLGRVKAEVYTEEETIETDWIPVINLYGNEDLGAFFIPETDNYAIVGFFGDNQKQGFVVGGSWAEDFNPPKTEENTSSDLNQDGDNNLRFIKTRSKHQLIFDDKDSQERMQIILSNAKTRYEFMSGDEVTNLKTDVDLKIIAKGKVEIEADQMEINLDKNAKIESMGIGIDAQKKEIKIKSGQNIGTEGITVKLN